MRNLYDLLNIDSTSSSEDIDQIIQTLPDEDIEIALEARMVLNQPEWRKQYELVHLQYEAMAAALTRFDSEQFNDSHQWKSRVVEFETDALGLDNSDGQSIGSG